MRMYDRPVSAASSYGALHFQHRSRCQACALTDEDAYAVLRYCRLRQQLRRRTLDPWITREVHLASELQQKGMKSKRVLHFPTGRKGESRDRSDERMMNEQ